MGLPVVVVSSGGLAVTESENGIGLAVDVATNGFGLAVTAVDSGGIPVVGLGAIILLSGSLTIAEDATVGDLVGTFSIGGNASGNWLDPITYTLTDDAGGKYAIDGDDLEVAAALSDGTDSITVEADNGTDAPITRTFSITVTAVVAPTDNMFDFTDPDNMKNLGLA